MRTAIHRLLAATALGLAAAPALAEGGRPGPHGLGMSDGPLALLERFDADRDGKVTRAEIEAESARRLGQFDTNRDGALDPAEFTLLFTEEMARPRIRAFQMLDEDDDGRISPAELDRQLGRLLTRLDQDGDGAVSRAELERMGPGRRRGHHGRGHD